MRNIMEYKGYLAKIEYSEKDETFFGVVQGINDRISFEGNSSSELKVAFHEAIDDYLDMCRRHGKEPEKSYKGSFNIRIDPELHKRAALIASSQEISLNRFVEAAISEKVNSYK